MATVNDAERAQLLRKLLARVRANAEARLPPGNAIAAEADAVLLERPIVVERDDELRAWPAAGERTSFPDQPEMTEDEGAAIAMRIDPLRPVRRSSRPPRGTEPLAFAERGVRSRLEADRWSVLLDDDAEGPMATFASEVPLPPPPANPTIEEKWRDREPEGALERAVRDAAYERASQRGAIWIDLVAELRERRTTNRPESEPEPEPPPVSEPASGLAEAFAASQEAPLEGSDNELPLSTRPSAPPVARSLSPSPYARDERPVTDTLRPAAPWSSRPTSSPDLRRSAPPSSLLPASRRLRRRAQRWSYAKRLITPRSGRFPAAVRALALVAAVGIVAVVIAVAVFRNPPQTPPVPTSKVETASQAATNATAHPLPIDTAAPTTTVTPSPSASAVTSAAPTEGGLTEEEGAPADTRQLPENIGYLFVVSPHKLPVYLNGVIAGETQRWLRVGCSWRYLRLARRGSPPVGSSFPVWATDGRSVMVPCRGATRIELPEDQ